MPAAALTYVAQFLSPGDVVLIEQQTVGPNGGTRYVPLEWQQSSMLGRFDRTVRDSGAIVVGAGSSNTAHTSLSFSSWGTRLDLQGVGQNVTTTGFNGNLFGGTAPESLNMRYTRSFSGTSSSGPIVANAVAAVQSYLKATGRMWTATQISNLLKSTGTPQGDPAHRVGEFPNIAAALKAIEVDKPTSSASFAADGTLTLTGDDGWGSGVARLEYRTDGGEWTTYATPFKPTGHVLEHPGDRPQRQRGRGEPDHAGRRHTGLRGRHRRRDPVADARRQCLVRRLHAGRREAVHRVGDRARDVDRRRRGALSERARAPDEREVLAPAAAAGSAARRARGARRCPTTRSRSASPRRSARTTRCAPAPTARR